MKYSLIYLITALLFSGNPENIYYDPLFAVIGIKKENSWR